MSIGRNRLSFAEVGRYVACLRDDVLEQLAEGPLPDEPPADAGCRVCKVLKPLSTPYKGNAPAEILVDWHEFPGDFTELEGKSVPGELADQVEDVFGCLAYARCCAIYLAAGLELERRRGRQEALGPTVDAIEQALPRNLYVRIGCGFEKASRPTIAATAALAMQGDV